MSVISNTQLARLPHSATARLAYHACGVLRGVLLTSLVAALAFALRQLPGVAIYSPMILAIVIGIAFHNLVGTPAWAKQGVAFSVRRLLRIAIILLGLQLTAAQVIDVCGRGLGIMPPPCLQPLHILFG